jgi:hypothetical protein
MSARWEAFDGLLRELGALRTEARTLDTDALGEAVIAEVDRLIGDAAQAVDGTIAGPENETLIVAACEAIVTARARIEALHTTASRSWDLIGRSIELRRKSAQLLYQQIRSREDR